MFEFVLFLILGLVVFANLQGSAKMVAMVVFVVLMVVWVIFGLTGWHVPTVTLPR